MSLLQSGELMKAYADLLYHAERAQASFGAIVYEASGGHDYSVTRLASEARQDLNDSIARARAITHPVVES